jgi:hypothetical protein
MLTAIQSTQVVAQQSQLDTLCLVDLSGLPIAVRFERSTTLMKAIKKAGIPRKRMKDEVEIMRIHNDGFLKVTIVNFKRIEKGKIANFKLDEHDLVYVIPKTHETRADFESIGRGCVACGCRRMPGMHGSFIIPKKWNESNVPAKDDSDPDSKKP